MEPRDAQRIVFFCHWNNGDVYLTRPLVNHLMKVLPGRGFSYAHACAPDLLADIDGLAYDPTPLRQLSNQPRWVFDEANATIYINTWVGMCGGYYCNQPVFGGHCIALVQFCFAEQMRDLFCMAGPTLQECIPTVNYSRFFIRGVDQFVQQYRQPKVLICNGNVHSQQAQNFDFTPIVDRLCQDFPELIFICTAPVSLSRPNLIQSADIIKKGGPDLNETGYLSQFCDIIVGRSSGPYTFSINARNLQSPKSYICFCNRAIEATYGLENPAFNIQCSFTVSNNYDPSVVLQVIEQRIVAALSGRSASVQEGRLVDTI